MTYHVFIGIASIFKSEHFLVDHRVDVVGLDGGHHILHERLGPNIHTASSADVGQALNDGRLGRRTTEETNNTDNTLKPNCRQTLLQCAGTANLDDVVDALLVVGQALSGLAPVLVLLVVDNVVCTELL